MSKDLSRVKISIRLDLQGKPWVRSFIRNATLMMDSLVGDLQVIRVVTLLEAIVVRAVGLTTRMFINGLPAARIVRASAFAVRLCPAFLLGNNARFFLARPFLRDKGSNAFAGRIRVLVCVKDKD